MKHAILGIVALMSFATPALARDDSYYRQTFYTDGSGRVVGRFVIYCDGRELEEGEFTNNSYSYYGSCDAP